jgi:hypothetical protein
MLGRGGRGGFSYNLAPWHIRYSCSQWRKCVLALYVNCKEPTTGSSSRLLSSCRDKCRLPNLIECECNHQVEHIHPKLSGRWGSVVQPDTLVRLWTRFNLSNTACYLWFYDSQLCIHFAACINHSTCDYVRRANEYPRPRRYSGLCCGCFKQGNISIL